MSGLIQDEDDSIPFKETPSGNLKVHRKNVIFQSKTLGIVAVNPRITTVEVRKATELDREIISKANGVTNEETRVNSDVLYGSRDGMNVLTTDGMTQKINKLESNVEEDSQIIMQNQRTSMFTEEERTALNCDRHTEVGSSLGNDVSHNIVNLRDGKSPELSQNAQPDINNILSAWKDRPENDAEHLNKVNDNNLGDENNDCHKSTAKDYLHSGMIQGVPVVNMSTSISDFDDYIKSQDGNPVVNTSTSISDFDDYIKSQDGNHEVLRDVVKNAAAKVHMFNTHRSRPKDKCEQAGKEHNLRDRQRIGSLKKFPKPSQDQKGGRPLRSPPRNEKASTPDNNSKGRRSRGSSSQRMKQDTENVERSSVSVKRKSRKSREREPSDGKKTDPISRPSRPKNKSGIKASKSKSPPSEIDVENAEARDVLTSQQVHKVGPGEKCILVKRQRGGASSSRIRAGPFGESLSSEKTLLHGHKHILDNTNLLSHLNWQKIPLPAKTNVRQKAGKMLCNPLDTDCKVIISPKKFHCYRLLLICYSGYFARRSVSPGNQYELPDNKVRPKIFPLVYKWMLCSKGEARMLLSPANVLDLLQAAQFLEIALLEDQCWSLIFNEGVFTETSALQLSLRALRLKNKQVMDLMEPRIMNCFLPLVSTADWDNLPIRMVRRLLSSNYIAVHCEMEVFMSAVKWLMHNFSARKKHVGSILRCIRFGLIPPWQIVDIRHNAGIPEYAAVVAFPEVHEMLDAGLSYGVNRCRYGFNTPEYLKVTKNLGLMEPEARNWVGENRIYRNYREFLEMLESFRLTALSRRKDPFKSSTPKSNTSTVTTHFRASWYENTLIAPPSLCSYMHAPCDNSSSPVTEEQSHCQGDLTTETGPSQSLYESKSNPTPVNKKTNLDKNSRNPDHS